MKAVSTLIFTCFLAATAVAEDALYTVDDPFVGIYEGTFQARFSTGKAEAQIRSLGNGKYDGFIALKSEVNGEEKLFSAGVITEFRPDADQKASIGAMHPNQLSQNAGKPDPKLTFPAMTITGEISPGKISGNITPPFGRGKFTYAMARIQNPKPPMLGAPPPKGAIVMFDGQDHGAWKENKWKINDGLLVAGGGNIVARQSLTNFILHVEFRTPNMPASLGQERGNSGVYLRSVFEVQVLDSFGLFPLEDNDCAGIYKVKAPDLDAVNACLPPGVWQTYDITYREGDKQSSRPPEITVVQNGKTVIDKVKIPLKIVVDGTGGGEVGGGFLMLQDHGNPVEYRNIWALPIE